MTYRLKIDPLAPIIPAAVLIPIIAEADGLHLLLNLRTDKVKHHKGQICFPGGAAEPNDLSLWHTAIRETEEELGLRQEQIYYIDELPKLLTPTSFEIVPYVGFIHSLDGVRPNLDEIKEIFSVPVCYFLNPDNLHYEERTYFGTSYPVPFFHFGPYEIWGATGRIILSLVERWGIWLPRICP